MLSIGKIIAAAVPIIVTATAINFSGSFSQIVLAETPALYASRNVVVTVERINMKSATIPSLAFTIIFAMSVSPVRIAAPIPIMYIQQEIIPYVRAETKVALNGFSAYFV